MQASEVGWSRYKDFEGPFTRGTMPYRMPAAATDEDRIMAIITATEGGRWNAVNMYDVCIYTVGLIQWCEGGYYLVSDMLGKVIERDPSLLAPMNSIMSASGAAFKRNSRGRWRFFFSDARGEVDRRQEQQQLFLLHSNGKRGTWDEASKSHAKEWAAAAVNIFENPDAIHVQQQYTVSRLYGFALPYARDIIKAAPDTPEGKAFVAAYLSFAANNPSWANKHLKIANETSKAPPYSPRWLVHVLRQLTFGPNVHIYPHRYNAIRKPLELWYGVELPDVAEQLKIRQLMPVDEIQRILVDLGYDLGSYGKNGDGVDGVYTFGGKTYQAIADFQRLHNITEDDDDKIGWVGDDTATALKAAREAIVEHQPEGDTITDEQRREVQALVNASITKSINDYFRRGINV